LFDPEARLHTDISTEAAYQLQFPLDNKPIGRYLLSWSGYRVQIRAGHVYREEKMRLVETTRRRVLAGIAASTLVAGLAGSAAAQDAKPLRIGIIDDLSGPNSGNSGPGTVEAAEMAIEDFGAKVLGRPIELLVATDENKPDIAVALARKFYDEDGVQMITGLAASNSALAVQNVAREANKISITSAAASAELTGKGCTPNSIHWMFDTYASALSLVDGIIQQGGKKWFFITVDVNFGRDMQATGTEFIEKQGGEVVGSVTHPLGNLDFSSAVLSAQNSGADVIALAQAGADLENTIKATREFGVLDGGQKLALFFLQTAQVESIGQEATQGLITPTPFFPRLNEETLAWTERFVKRVPGGRVPTANQANAYAAVTHYLKAVEAAGTDESEAVLAKMREMPINDMMTKDGIVREDGRVLRDLHIVEVKAPSESSGDYDYFKVLTTVPKDRAYRSINDGGCEYVQ
jgi:branched-chain amino acid transport system substrate-binding protein